MTSNTDKLRAVFLTALMIGSVFAAGVAFTGSAAAGPATAAQDGSVSPNSTDADTQYSFDISVNLTDVNTSDGDTGAWANFTLPSEFDLSSISLTNEAVEGSSSGASASTSVSSSESGNSVNITWNDNAGLSNNETVNVSFQADQITTPDVDTDTDYDVTVTTDVNADGTTEVSGATVDTITVNADETSFNDGGIVFEGQTLTYDAEERDGNFGSQNGYTLYERTDSSSGSPVRELNTNNGLVNVSTAGLSNGQTYFVSNDGQSPSNADINFTVREMDFDVAIDGDSVPNDDTGIDVTWTSTNRQNNPYNVTVTADGLDDSELLDVFEDNYDVTDFDTATEDGVEVEVPSGGEATAAANFSGIDAGSYDFDFDVTDTSASDSESLNVTSAAEADSSFNSIDRVARGDVSTVNVSVTSATYATVQIGSENVGYEANVTVQDEDGDGVVAFDVNTFTMGNNTDVNAEENAFTIVGDEDSITDVNITTGNLSSPIASGNYRTTVRTGQDADATADDVSRLSITDNAGVTGQNIWTAPGALDADEVLGAVSQDSSIAEGDYVVHEVQAQGVFGVIQSDTSSTNTTAQSLAMAVSKGNLSLTVEQTPATTQLNKDPKSLNYASLLANGDATVVTDAANNTFYIVAHSDDLAPQTSSRSIQWGDDAYNATAGLSANTNLVDEDSTASAEYSAVELTAELSMNEYNVTNAENQTITGTTSAADGTQYNVLVESLETEGDGFIMPENAAIAEDGELSTQVDFTEASVGDTFQVTLEGPGAEDDTATGNVVEDTGGETTTTTADDTTTTTADDTTTTTADDTTTTTADDTTTTTADDTTTEGGDGDDGGSSGGSIPGFGVGIALVAILGAALLALRE